jgi:uncharacterized protein (TIGR02118 family)
MFKVSVLYPAAGGARFDHAYYAGTHMPLSGRLLQPLYYEIDQGLAGGAPGAPAPFVGACHFYFADLESFQSAFGAHGPELQADIPAFTDIAPEIQISSVAARAGTGPAPRWAGGA